ncbi:MAG: DUF177 domain-containing protein [Candidatus Omnitrophota bacterium]
MKIKVHEISGSGLLLSETFDAVAWELQRDDIKFDEPIKVNAFVIKDKENISIDAGFTSTIILTCSRCLREFKMPLAKTVKLFFQLKGEHIIDISNDIREEIFLDYPIKILCADDCKGLCQRCGKDLNERSCNCNV